MILFYCEEVDAYFLISTSDKIREMLPDLMHGATKYWVIWRSE